MPPLKDFYIQHTEQSYKMLELIEQTSQMFSLFVGQNEQCGGVTSGLFTIFRLFSNKTISQDSKYNDNYH